jgi:Cytosine/uracil/thiamine/allantoin permeases
MSTSSGLAANAPDVEADIAQSRLFNADLAPVPQSRRKWGMLSFAALWISMSACIPTYMLASGLIGGGMNWWQAILTIFLGNLIVLMPMILNAHAGTKYGIPFPVYCRASFGILIADYFVCRRCRLNVTALYKSDGEYRFTNGFSIVALIALVIGALPSLPGFLVNIKVLSAESIPASLAHLYNYAWFIGFAVAFTVYLTLRKLAPKS